MTNLRCVVVDDEPLAAQLIASYVCRTPFLTLAGTASNAEEAMGIIRDGDIDLVFLDIHMPGMSGMEFARILPAPTSVVFTTAYADHAVEGFRVDAVDYLLKPVSYNDFLEAANRAAVRHTPSAGTLVADDYIVVKSEYRLLRIPVAEITYIEGLKDYVKIYLDGDQRPVLTLMSMRSLEENLSRKNFMRTHRSFIVNCAKVRVIERNCIIMQGRSLPIGDTYRKAFFDAIGVS